MGRHRSQRYLCDRPRQSHHSMKSRSSSLRRWLQKFFGQRRPAPLPVPARRSATARVRSGIEPLEGRVAPAILVSPMAISYTDLDGDNVTVTFSKSLFDPAKTATENHLDNVFKFVDGQHASSLFASNGPQQLQLI